jgi:putative FmdB family regulatory protein
MPLYEYVCGDCAAAFETLVRRWGDAVACPRCASGAVEKQLSSFAVASASPSLPAEGCGLPQGGCGAPVCGGGACGLGD